MRHYLPRFVPALALAGQTQRHQNLFGIALRTISAAIAFVGTASFAVAEQANIDDLSDYEKSLHRWAWCSGVASSTGICEFGCNDILKIGNLLSDNARNSRENDPRRVYMRSRSDTEAALLLGKITPSEEILERCEADMLSILEDQYIPNFEYLEQSNQ